MEPVVTDFHEKTRYQKLKIQNVDAYLADRTGGFHLTAWRDLLHLTFPCRPSLHCTVAKLPPPRPPFPLFICNSFQMAPHLKLDLWLPMSPSLFICNLVSRDAA